MSELHVDTMPTSVETAHQEVEQELKRIERRDWWVWGYSLLVILLLTLAVIAVSLPAVREGAETFFNIKISEVVFGLTALVMLFNIYTVYQQILIKRLRQQLAEKQGHSDILRSLAMVDPLTGLYNRRFAEQRLEAEVARSERKGHPLTVLTLDLNNFKEVNDTHGHSAGDLVLQEFAAHLNKVIRGTDLAVRLGGDEFLVLLPECTLEQLQLVLGRLGSLEVNWRGEKIPVTFSAGWKQYELGDRPTELLERADRLLYDRKRSSKRSGPAKEKGKEKRTKQLRVLVDLTCPHCNRKNSVAVDTQSGASAPAQQEVQCAHCKQPWDALLFGPVLAGPFPK
jgi:diguanylate cyclase (GGDEF)-like protein